MLIINGKINPVTSLAIENGYIQITDGKIAKIGAMSELNITEQDTLDAAGGHVFPGFIDAHCHLGMWEDSLAFEGDDGNESTDPITPHLRAIDGLNPLDKCFEEARQAGITTVMTGPGSANPIGGLFAAIKTAGRRVDDMILLSPACMKFALGENPKSVYNAKNQTPITRMATAAIIRETLEKAVEYKVKKLSDDPDETPDFDAKLESLIPLLEKRITAHFHAHRADDIFTAMRIAKEFNLDYVIVHGTQGHTVADILGQEAAKVIAGPIICDRSKPELSALTPKGPGLLAAQGVSVAICTDHPVIPVQYLPLCTALAVKEGMNPDAAIQAVTINAARICNIADRVGSLEPGKDADIVIHSAHPLDFNSRAQYVLVDGKIVERLI